ncbi:MAG: LamB/YcsF family protein [Acidobacteria bacterium]|nr:LamB/YcsF family protein [Acidobacteriota bacterium]
MTKRVDLNCDLGELPGDAARALDRRMMEVVTSVNVACGAHAGDVKTMRATVRAARDAGVGVGAHPGFADREGFGRRELDLPLAEIDALIRGQVEALQEIAAAEGVAVRHVKAHGALYNMAARDRTLADAVACAVAACDPGLAFLGLPGSLLVDAGRDAGLAVVPEVFADRAYQANGALVPRTQPGAVIHDAEVAVERAVGMVRDGAVTAIDGTRVALTAGTICVHGDTPGADAIARQLRDGLEAAGVEVAPLQAA